MNLLEAKELLKKFKSLENHCNTKNGWPIQRFFIIPLKYINENNIHLDWYKIWENDELFQTDQYENLEFEILGVHRSSLSTFWYSNDIKYFKDLVEKRNNETEKPNS